MSPLFKGGNFSKTITGIERCNPGESDGVGKIHLAGCSERFLPSSLATALKNLPTPVINIDMTLYGT